MRRRPYSPPVPDRSRLWFERRDRPPPPAVSAAPSVGLHHAAHLLSRKYQGKTGPMPGATAHLDGAAMLGDDLLDNRKPNSGSSLARFLRFLRAVELLEDLSHFLLIHSDALILHR